ncbi:MAG: DinB family protein [Armatimonadetes bacterium]|nr:DinB family protein [Armatimonadota bacterium]
MPIDVSRYTSPLSRTPRELRTIVQGRTDEELASRHAADVVSPRQAVGHLLLCECEGWIERVKFVLDPQSVSPMDEVAELARIRTLSLDQTLDEFEERRLMAIDRLRGLGLSEDDLERSYDDEEIGPFTVRSVLACWVAHDHYHLGQIYKSFAALWKDEIGPWQAFLNLPNFN